MDVVLPVLGILLLVVLAQALIWIPLVVRWRRRAATFWAAFDAGVAAGDETIVRPVESGVYRGGTGSYSNVKGNGRLVLTSRRLLFRKVTGGVVEVPAAAITGAHRAKAFLGSVVATREHLVVELADGAQVGFFVADLDGWIDQIGTRRTS